MNVSADIMMNEDYHGGNYTTCMSDNLLRSSISYGESCRYFTDCITCVQTSYGCVWCGKSCAYKNCRFAANTVPVQATIPSLEYCDANTGIECLQLHTCQACSNNPRCLWSWSNGPDRCKPLSDLTIVSALESLNISCLIKYDLQLYIHVS